MQFDILLPIIFYLLLVLLISLATFLTRKKTGQLSHYFIGDRSMGGFLLAMTMATTYVSASSFIGGPGAAYKYGLGWVMLSMIQVPAVLLSLSVLGKKFAIIARQYNAVTLNDVLYHRYRSRAVVNIASLALIAAFMGTITVQFIGGARLLESAVGIPYNVALISFIFVTSLYTAIGGFRASVINDALQGIIMLIGAIIFLAAVIYTAGGLTNAISTLHEIDPTLLTPQGADGFITLPFILSFWILVCFGVIGLPHTAVRCMAYKDSKALHRGIITGTIIMAILMFSMHFAGALGRAILPDLTIPDQAVPLLMKQILPPYLAGIFLAAPLAAIMSTVNAQLLQITSVLINDLYLQLKPAAKTNDGRLTRIAILLTFGLGFVLVFAAWHPPSMLIWLNLISFGGLQTAFLWPLVLGLYWENANAAGALSSICAGTLCYVFLLSYTINIYGLHPIVPSLLIGLIAFVVGNKCSRQSTISEKI